MQSARRSKAGGARAAGAGSYGYDQHADPSYSKKNFKSGAAGGATTAAAQTKAGGVSSAAVTGGASVSTKTGGKPQAKAGANKTVDATGSSGKKQKSSSAWGKDSNQWDLEYYGADKHAFFAGGEQIANEELGGDLEEEQGFVEDEKDEKRMESFDRCTKKLFLNHDKNTVLEL